MLTVKQKVGEPDLALKFSIYRPGQAQLSLKNWISGGQTAAPSLIIPVARTLDEAAGAMRTEIGAIECKPPQPRLHRVRRIAGTAVGLLFALTPF